MIRLWKKWEKSQIHAESDLGCPTPSRRHPAHVPVETILQVVSSRPGLNRRTHPRGNPRVTAIFPRHEATRDAPIVSGVAIARRSVLKALATATRDPREVRTKVNGRIRESQVGGIKDLEATACPVRKGGRVAREGKVKAMGRIKGKQGVGIVDPGAAVRPVRRGGRATKNPREGKHRRVPLARGPPRRLQVRTVHGLTMFSMAP